MLVKCRLHIMCLYIYLQGHTMDSFSFFNPVGPFVKFEPHDIAALLYRVFGQGLMNVMSW